MRDMPQDRNLSGCQVFDPTDVPSDWDCAPLGSRVELDYGRGLPEEDQAAIARILDAVDTTWERTHAAVERARELDHSLLHELFEKGLEPKRPTTRRYPTHWSMTRVDEVAEVGSGVTLGKDVSGFK